MEMFHISDIISVLGLPYPALGQTSYYIPCPCCDKEPHKKHLNINVKKDVFRCPRCGVSGGIFDLYSLFTGVPRDKVLIALTERFGTPMRVNKPKVKIEKHMPSMAICECPITDVESRHATYSALLEKLSLAKDHKENLINRGLAQSDIERLGYKTTPIIGMQSLAKQDGKTLVIKNTNVSDIAYIRFNHIQFYNDEQIQVYDNNQYELKRRFIANANQFFKLGEFSNADGEIRLIEDLNLASYSNKTVNVFNADFNGNGHTISNINFSIGDQKLNDNDVSHSLFGKINNGATVRNLTLRNVNVTSGKQHKGKKSYIVGAVSHTNYGTIENVRVYGNMNIERQGSIVGGIAAKNYGTIKNSTNYASFRGSGDMGGIVGQNCGVIEECNNNGRMVIVYKESRSMGGIVGYNNGGVVRDCNQGGHITSENTIKGKINVGCIIGHNSGSFDEKGYCGSFNVTYTYYEGFIFGWGAFDNGAYLFAYCNYRVGKQG